nr:hypothetical protein [Tanacetum cinerariifolium]
MALHRQMGLSFQAAIVMGKKSGRILVLRKVQITLGQYIDIYDGTRTCFLGKSACRKREARPPCSEVDTTIIQAIKILADFDKELHTYAMRVHEWYVWYFPELGNIVQGGVRSLTFSHDGKYVLSSTLGERYVDVWEVAGSKKKSACCVLAMGCPDLL